MIQKIINRFIYATILTLAVNNSLAANTNGASYKIQCHSDKVIVLKDGIQQCKKRSIRAASNPAPVATGMSKYAFK